MVNSLKEIAMGAYFVSSLALVGNIVIPIHLQFVPLQHAQTTFKHLYRWMRKLVKAMFTTYPSSSTSSTRRITLTYELINWSGRL